MFGKAESAKPHNTHNTNLRFSLENPVSAAAGQELSGLGKTHALAAMLSAHTGNILEHTR